MLTAVPVEPGRLEIVEVPRPHPGPGEVVLQVVSALTCGADLRNWRQGSGPLGRHFSGRVAEVGPQVSGWREGDPVMAAHTAPCGACYPCQRDQANLCEGLEVDAVAGGFAEYVRLNASIVRQALLPRPASLSFAEAAFLDPLAAVLQGLESIPGEPEDTVVILGDGPTGLLFLTALRALGRPHRILLADHGRERLDLAAALGADRVVDSQAELVLEAVRDLTGGLGAEVIMDCTGRPSAFGRVLELARRGSQILLVGGRPSHDPMELDTTRLHYDQIRLVGTHHSTPQAVRAAGRLLAEGRVRPDRLLSGTRTFEELPRTFQDLDRGRGLTFEILPPPPEEPAR